MRRSAKTRSSGSPTPARHAGKVHDCPHCGSEVLHQTRGEFIASCTLHGSALSVPVDQLPPDNPLGDALARYPYWFCPACNEGGLLQGQRATRL